MPFVEEPAHLSKSRLKSDLVAHNVALPPAASKRAVYVELHLKHIDQKNAADFSSDEEDRAGDVSPYFVATWFFYCRLFRSRDELNEWQWQSIRSVQRLFSIGCHNWCPYIKLVSIMPDVANANSFTPQQHKFSSCVLWRCGALDHCFRTALLLLHTWGLQALKPPAVQLVYVTWDVSVMEATITGVCAPVMLI